MCLLTCQFAPPKTAGQLAIFTFSTAMKLSVLLAALGLLAVAPVVVVAIDDLEGDCVLRIVDNVDLLGNDLKSEYARFCCQYCSWVKECNTFT